MEKVRFASQRQTEIGGGDDGLMLASDQNIVSVKFTVFWRVNDAEEYLFNIQDPEAVIRAVAESAMREIVGRTPAEKFRTGGRKAAEDQVFEITQTTLDAYKAGVLVTGIRLNEADPPPEVRDAFAEVQRAEQDQAKLINEADQYANQKIRRAEGEAAKIVEDAKAYKAQVVLEAEGEAQRFVNVYEEYSKAKDVTRERLYLETLEDVMSKSNKVLIEGENANGVVPYLPLPELQKRNPTTTTTSPDEGAAATGATQQ
jgi:membrane protease subunit HflK